MWFIVTILGLIVAVVAVFIVSRFRYYGQLFSEDNFRVFHNALTHAIEIAKTKHSDLKPNLEDGTAFVTSAGLAVAVTYSRVENGSATLHVSISERSKHTTHAVALRFCFFVTATLKQNKAELIPYFTESGVHHIVFHMISQDLITETFDVAYFHYRKDYRPIPFRLQHLKDEHKEASKGSG